MDCPITEDEVKLAVEKLLQGNSFGLINYEILPASKEPLGFLGDHVRITARVSKEDNEPIICNFFAKKIPTKVQSQRDYAEGTRAFYKEIELYKTLFDDLENAISPERREHSKWRPACYFTRDWDLVIVEDLAPQGFNMLPERSFMTLEQLQATIRTLAKMHAGSIIFEEKLNSGKCGTKSLLYNRGTGRQTIQDLYPNLIFESECVDTEGHPGYAFWEAGIRGQTAVFDELAEYSPEEKVAIKQKLPETIRQIYRMLEPSKKFRNVMIHADLWGNNLLFRDASNGLEALTVDFQMTRYAPPAHELMLLLYTMQNWPFRAAHQSALLDHYYDALSQELSGEDLDVAQLLPRQEFDESCAFYKRYAVLNQIINTQLIITPPELSGQYFSSSADWDRIMYVDRSQLLIESFRRDELCRVRTTECMVELVETFNLL